MIQTTEREEINSEIIAKLNKGMLHKDIAKETGVSAGWVSRVAVANGLERKSKFNNKTDTMGIKPVGGNTINDLRQIHRFKAGQNVIVQDFNGFGTIKSYRCVVEKVTNFIVFSRDENGMMHTVAFPVMGMDSKAIVRR